MKRVVNVNDVKVNTVSIEIHTLRVGNKQVTQSLFKQLPRESIIDENGFIVGIPWGYIYFDDGIRFLFQIKDKLYVDWAEIIDNMGRKPLKYTLTNKDVPPSYAIRYFNKCNKMFYELSDHLCNNGCPYIDKCRSSAPYCKLYDNANNIIVEIPKAEKNIIEKSIKIMTNFNESLEKLKGLEQLFIAV